MLSSDENITYFAETDFRNNRERFGIKQKDRTRHLYVIGKTGMGKSTLLENIAVQDIQNDEGVTFIDPHGKTAELLLDYVPEHRIKDVLYFAPFDLDFPISFNVMEDVGTGEKRHLVASGLMSAFKKIWIDMWSARMEYILNNTLLALLEYPDATILGVNRMLSDKVYRNRVVSNITDDSVKAFWEEEFAKYGDRYMTEAGAAIQNKVGQFVSNPVVRNVVGQPKSSFDMRQMIDEGKILVVNLSKGRVGEDNANLLGSMFITKLYLAAMSRADLSPRALDQLPTMYLYVDEFQSFANESFADILSEARKYKLALHLAHQYIEQMSDEVRAAVFGNVGTLITFRVGSFDAEVFEKEFAPHFSAEDIVNLGQFQMYLRLMIDGVGSKPFSASGLPPIKPPRQSFKENILDHSRKMYARPRAEVQSTVAAWYESRAGLVSEEGKKKILKSHQKDSTKESKKEDGSSKKRKKKTTKQSSLSNKYRQQNAQQKRGSKKSSSKKIKGSRSKKQSVEGSEERLQKAISLSRLKSTTEEKKKQQDRKKVSSKNLSSLKEALADIMKEQSQEEAGKKKNPRTSQSSSTKSKTPTRAFSKERNKPTTTTEDVKEVSKDVLEKLLHPDD